MSGAVPLVRLEVVPIGTLAPELLPWLAAELEAQLPWARCAPARPFAPRDEWGAPYPGRFPVDLVLDSLVEWHAAREYDPLHHWILGVTATDFAAPDRSFAFGEATVGGCCAVISLARLHAPGGDAAAERALLRTRILKEACHELGHVVGLPHCPRTGCVMHPSPGVDAVDRKSADLCDACDPTARQLLRERS
jgi:predicted Zn-dependent protease